MASMTVSSIRLSVIIPTRGRHDVLPEVLASLRGQTCIDRAAFEIIIIADGLDEPEALPHGHVTGFTSFHYERQKRSGPAAARNRGAAISRGEYLLFLGNDTLADEGCFAAHLSHHARHEASACLGYIHSPDENESNLDRFCSLGSQFSFPSAAGTTDFWHFYTANISLPRVLFEKLGGFSTAFGHAGWEDAEFGYRLTRQNCIVYEPAAIVEHIHPFDLNRFIERQRILGRDASIMLDLHPELDRAFRLRSAPLLRMFKKILALGVAGSLLHRAYPLMERLAYSTFVHYYFRLLRYHHFYRGFLESEQSSERTEAGI